MKALTPMFKRNKFKYIINNIILPIKLIIPQPMIKCIPGLTTNEEIRIENVLRLVPPDSNCLDIGCGVNLLMKKHRQRGGIGLGVDIYDWGDVDLITEDTSKLPFEDKSFDCITFVASLNHIPNRVEVLKEVYRILRDGGIVIITFLTPKLSAFWHKICFWDKDQKERGIKKGEVYGFAPNELCLLLKSTGFKIIKKKRFSWWLNNLYLCTKA